MNEPLLPTGHSPPPASGDAKPTESPSHPTGGRRWPLASAGLLAALLSIGTGLWITGLWDRLVGPGSSDLPADIPLVPISSSPFKNTGPEAHYVGSDSCQACHQSRTASFRRTGMGRSMAEVNAAEEPPDVVFDHAASKRRYQVTRQGAESWHRELLLEGGTEEVVLSAYPVKYAVGSGRHGRTYLVEAEGFLVQSPVTWFASRQAWGMSPGYDRPHHQGFERAIDQSCLACHAGRAEPIGQSLHRMRITEAAIGCERCHGPGSLHVDWYSKHRGAEPLQGIDHTIVNPSHLSRELAEAVCQQCHLQGATLVVNRGRKLSDFRPGLPVQDFWQVYGLEVDARPMTVTGHVEQLHLSRCYKESAKLTCTTCHDPHGMPRPEERLAHYQAICLNCHQRERCKVGKERLLHESPHNDCAQCHMPRGETDIPHVAFAHHRIGVHDKPAADPGTAGGVLKPYLDDSRFSEADKKRSLGLAYLNLAREEKQQDLTRHYQSLARQALSDEATAPLRDPLLTLVRLRFEEDQDRVLGVAEGVLAFPDLSGADRCAGLFLVAAERLKRQQYNQALAALRQLVTLRRHPRDWVMLARCQEMLGNTEDCVDALEMAVRIKPDQTQIHQYLAQYYRQQGNKQRAAWHQLRAQP
jgi:predicted CXXCH cytochrome family protein